MKQLAIDPKYIVDIKLKGVADILKPVVFKEGDSFCCILGMDPVEGVFGCGDTPEDAVNDWDETLKLRLEESDDNDEVVKHVKEVLAKRPKPKHVQEFYDQFRPVKKK